MKRNFAGFLLLGVLSACAGAPKAEPVTAVVANERDLTVARQYLSEKKENFGRFASRVPSVCEEGSLDAVLAGDPCREDLLIAESVTFLSQAGLKEAEIGRMARRDAERFEDALRRTKRMSDVASPSLGPDDAPVTIKVFSDFRCPYCAEAHKMLNEVRKIYGDNIRIVYKYYVLPYKEHSTALTLIAMAAQRLGKFWEYHDDFFENRGDIDANYVRERHETLSSLPGAEKIFGDGKELTNEARERFTVLLHNDLSQADELGLRGVPTILINGVEIDAPFYKDRILNRIAAELVLSETKTVREVEASFKQKMSAEAFKGLDAEKQMQFIDIAKVIPALGFGRSDKKEEENRLTPEIISLYDEILATDGAFSGAHEALFVHLSDGLKRCKDRCTREESNRIYESVLLKRAEGLGQSNHQ